MTAASGEDQALERFRIIRPFARASAGWGGYPKRRPYRYGMGQVTPLVYNDVKLCYNDTMSPDVGNPSGSLKPFRTGTAPSY